MLTRIKGKVKATLRLGNVANNQAIYGSTRGMLVTGDFRPPTLCAPADPHRLDAPLGGEELLAQRHLMASALPGRRDRG